MADGERKPVTVSRRIGAPVHDIFQILTDPARHTELDGSGMLRGAVTTAAITAAGDVFVMKMYHGPYGDYEMNNHVVEYEQDRRVGWEPRVGRGHPSAQTEDPGEEWGHRWSYELTSVGPDATIVTEIYDCSRAPADARAGMDDGAVWIEAMLGTLERLDELATQRPSSVKA